MYFMYSIKSVIARQIFDSRGFPTIETTIKTSFGRFKAAVPSGASTGEKEALELRDKEKAFNGKGVNKAIANVNNVLANAVIGKDCRNQQEIDDVMIKLDGTDNKSVLGANAILSVSLAIAKAGAVVSSSSRELYVYLSKLSNKQMCLPVPALNIINGGKHAGNDLDVQEYQILPIKFNSFEESFSAGVEVFQELKKSLETKYGKSATNVGDEGGFAPNLSKIEEPLDEIYSVIEKLGYAGQIGLAMDVAASSFSKKDSSIKYGLEKYDLTGDQLLDEYKALCQIYPIVSIEDSFDENDYVMWKKIISEIGHKVQIVADDLTVSQKKFVLDSIENKRANALLLKVNQVGTLSEAIDSANTALKANWNVQVSHRSGETNDSFIADLAVGLGTGQIKSGAPCRGERIAKYNRILQIEKESDIKFIGKKAFPNF
ncbi:MAG: phosphopyruvate hydratase [Candidatus ainarchaeum sp.]|nr:phosphopyruvate hydratase [Candidatus ainarchaeum sp.]